MNVAVAIGGLAFLILIHEAGHFFIALAVKMRPRRFYIFFPPALVKWNRNGIEYGIGVDPARRLREDPGDAQAGRGRPGGHLGAGREGGALARRGRGARGEGARRGATRGRAGRTDRAAREVERAELSERRAQGGRPRAHRRRRRALAEAYWRAPTCKRVAVIFAGPATNYVFAVLALAIVFMLGVPTGATRTVEEVGRGSPAAAMGLKPGDEILAVNGTRGRGRGARRGDPRRATASRSTLTVERDGSSCSSRGRRRTRRRRIYRLGFAFGLEYESYGPLEAIGLAFETTWEVTKAIVSSLGAPRHRRRA